MHRKMLENFAVMATIAMVLLSNITAAMAFNNSPLNEAEKTSPLNDHSSPIAFEDLWKMGNNPTVNCENFVVDEDSMQLIVGLDYANSWACNSIGEWVAQSGGRIVNTVSTDGKVIAVVADIPLKAVSSFIEQMSRNPLVRYVEPNMKRRALFEPNDPGWKEQWGPKMIEANWAWNKTQGSSDIIVAVVDTGVDYMHRDISANYVALGYDWVNNDTDPWDDHWHGTHCAGIIAAVINNNYGVAGLAQVKIMAEKVLDSSGIGYDDWVANGIIHAADSGAKIVSMSLGGYGYSRLLHEAVKYAYEKGVLLVAAAGNDNINVKVYPAAYEEVVAVAATDEYDDRAWFSNWGDWIELSAPGVMIYSTVPGGFAYASGTSMACPHVSGTAALIWSVYPNVTNSWVRAQLRYTADDLGNPGFDEYYGRGRVNARKAVEQEPPEHDLLILSVQGPQYICPGDTAHYNVTVLNFGKNNETDINVNFIVNDSTVDSRVIGVLANGTSVRVTFSWTPTVEGVYNVTFWVKPVIGEVNTLNNAVSWFVTVTYPLIKPMEGQWAKYKIDYYDPNTGQPYFTVYWNLTYEEYIEPYRIYITISAEDPYGNVYTGWMIVNTLSRLVEEGVWAGLWYPGWIETNINIGSKVNLLYGTATVTGSKIILVGIYPIECWELTYQWDYYTRDLLWYDKKTGLWIGMDETVSYLPYHPVELRLVETNIPIGTTYPHELAATLEAPKRLEPGETIILNATALNIGLNDETNVKLSILINGTEVASETFNLPVNSSHTIRYVWTPETEAFYNITAYVRPVSGKFTAINNKAEKIVRVLKIRGYVLFDQTHGTDSIFTYSIWVKAIEDKGYIVEVLTTAPINRSKLEGYDIFVIPQARDYYTSDELSAIREFVLDGGGLLVIGDDRPDIYTELTNFAGISWGYGGYGGYASDITPHPVTEGVKSAFFVSPSSSLIVSSPALGLIRDRGGYVMLAVSEVGKGAVICIADEDSISNYAISYADNLRLAKNMIDWLAGRPPKVFVVYSPLDPYVGETIIFNASASYDPDGTIVDYVWDFGDGTIQHAGAVVSHVYTKGGTYTVSCTAIDNEGLNSALKIEITVQRTTLNVQVKVGTMHFAGEMAEFYILTSSLGEPINAEVSAQLYFNGSLYADLSDAIETLSQGFYRIPCTIPGNASAGTYTLIVKAKYYSLSGVSIESFQLSRTLSGWNAQIQEIRENIATFVIPDLGAIRLNLTALTDMNMTLQNIFLKVIAINGTTARIETTLGIVNGTVTEIKGNMATIVVPGLGQVQTDISNLIGRQETWTMPQYLIMAFSIIAAAGAVLSVGLLLRQKHAKTWA